MAKGEFKAARSAQMARIPFAASCAANKARAVSLHGL